MRYTFFVFVLACVLVVPYEAQAQCTVCDSCFDDFDCGLDEFCADFTNGSRCTAFCDFSACPGDSECYEVPVDVGGVVYLCLNPGAEVSFCDPSYSCGGGGTDPVDLCDGVVCPGGGICSPATGTCIGGGEDTSPPPDTSPPADTTPVDTNTTDTAPSIDTHVQPTAQPPDTQSNADTEAADGGRIDATGEGCSCAVRRDADRKTRGAVPLIAVLVMSLVWTRRRR